MKTAMTRGILLAQILSLLIFVSCEEDKETESVFDAPTISISSPVIPAEGLEIEIGQTVDVVLDLTAEAGLVLLTANEQTIKSYGGTELSDQLTYQIVPTEEGSFDIIFVVTDAKEESVTVSISVEAVEPAIPPFILSDLAGTSSSSEEVDVEGQGWDLRTIWSFVNTSNLSSTVATLQFVASQGYAAFGQDNPDDTQTDKVLKIVGATETGEDSWGGHYIFGMIGLGEVIPAIELSALPQIEFSGTIDIDEDEEVDASIASVKSGYTRVIQVDAYYDDTVNPNLTMNDIKQVTKIYGLDLSKGYQVDLALVNTAQHMDITTGEIQGFYSSYSAWIEEPNKWVTLTFEVASEAQQQFLDDGDGPNKESANPVAADMVDGVTLIPAYTHSIWDFWDDVALVLDGDTNPLYFRNLRIVNAVE